MSDDGAVIVPAGPDGLGRTPEAGEPVAAAAAAEGASRSQAAPLLPRPLPPIPKPPAPGEALPIRMLHDRVLVRLDAESAERRSSGGILIPATAEVGRRMAWAWVMAAGQHVRQVAVGDRVMFDPKEQAEVELQGVDYILLRERDIHAVAQPDAEVHGTGLYL